MKNLFSLLMFCFLMNGAFAQGDVAHGEQLFKANCTACHKPDRILIGPALKGVSAKYENDIAYLTSFVNNSTEVIGSGDERAVTIFNEFNKQVMTSFPTLSSQDVTDILAYADSFEKAEVAGIKIRPLPPKAASNMRPFYLVKNFGMWVLYGVVVLMLLAALYMMVIMSDMLSERNKK